jgi:hypothetical protein
MDTTDRTDYPGCVFCQYATNKCGETLSVHEKDKVLFLYPSESSIISSTIESSAEALSKKHTNISYLTWKDLKTQGKIIFCEICKAIFSSSYLICDITTLNFNVLFEIGYIYGLSKPLIPIFDTSFGGSKMLDKIGLLDTVGYKSFTNSQDLISIAEAGPSDVILQRASAIDTFRPLYYLKTPLDTEGSLRITASLKKSWFRFRLFDSNERPRLPLNLAIKEIDKSRAIVAHLLSPKRGDIALIHNARCAFVAGFAMASQKRVLLIQETKVEHPIDYRDIIKEYDDVSHINVIMDEFFRDLVDTLQTPIQNVEAVQRSVLEDIDLGDIAAENEIENLKSYYVRTGQFTSARKAHAQLVVGRKGSGKTALFYALRHHIGIDRISALVLDLKPEGYQFAKLHDTILDKFSEAVRQHTLTAIWDYVLLLELTHKILNDRKEIHFAHNNSEKQKLWNEIRDEYKLHRNIEEGDFSERLNNLIDNIIRRAPDKSGTLSSPEITQLVFLHDIQKLRNLLVAYLKDKEEVWLLFDNLDKNWRIDQKDNYEAIILRCLLDANRKLQKMLLKERVNFHSVVFIRNDIYAFFLEKTTDRGKDQVIYLNWDDINLFGEIFRLRVETSSNFEGSLEEIWAKIFDLHVQGESSFNYIISRTLMRPRDFLVFTHYALQTAINRGHNRVSEEDVLHAEEAYSRDLFEGLLYEIRDIYPELENVLYSFLESNRTMYESKLIELLKEAKVPEKEIKNMIDTLLWFCFIGICASDMSERYAYSVGHDIKMLMKLSDWTQKEKSERIYMIHPGFSKVLETKTK